MSKTNPIKQKRTVPAWFLLNSNPELPSSRKRSKTTDKQGGLV